MSLLICHAPYRKYLVIILLERVANQMIGMTFSLFCHGNHYLFPYYSRQIVIHFANSSKVKVTVSTTDTTSDLLDKSEIKDHLSSSTVYIVRVDDTGKGLLNMAFWDDLSISSYISFFFYRLYFGEWGPSCLVSCQDHHLLCRGIFTQGNFVQPHVVLYMDTFLRCIFIFYYE